MPLVGSFHEIHAFAHDCGHQHHRWLPRSTAGFCGRNGLIKCVKVVAIAGQDMPTEGFPFGFQIAERHDVIGGTINLLAVAIHKADDVVNLVVSRVHRGLPDLAFLQLAVTVYTDVPHTLGQGAVEPPPPPPPKVEEAWECEICAAAFPRRTCPWHMVHSRMCRIERIMDSRLAFLDQVIATTGAR